MNARRTMLENLGLQIDKVVDLETPASITQVEVYSAKAEKPMPVTICIAHGAAIKVFKKALKKRFGKKVQFEEVPPPTPD